MPAIVLTALAPSMGTAPLVAAPAVLPAGGCVFAAFPYPVLAHEVHRLASGVVA